MTQCNGCGQCCDPVVSPFTLDQLRMLLPIQLDAEQQANKAFMLAHLTPMTRREGLTKATWLTQGGVTYAIIGGQPVEVWSNFYSCEFFDQEARACLAYDQRPPMCSGYPWYGEQPITNTALPEQCEFHRDVGREPVPVAPPTRRRP